jgi:hypothetical protein
MAHHQQGWKELILTWLQWSTGCELPQPQANLGTAHRNLQGTQSSLVQLIPKRIEQVKFNEKKECDIAWCFLPSSWFAAWPMFWAQFTTILRALASNASCMKAGLSQSSAVESHQTWIITIINAGIILKMPGTSTNVLENEINEYLFWQRIWIASDVVHCPCKPLYQQAVFQRSIEKQFSLESLQPAGTIKRLHVNIPLTKME